MVLPDKRVIACNVTEATAEAARGAAAYVRWTNGGRGNDRLALLIRSRGGRWIEKWESISRLGNFRLRTVPPEHPLYARLGEHSDETLDWIRRCSEYIAQARTVSSD